MKLKTIYFNYIWYYIFYIILYDILIQFKIISLNEIFTLINKTALYKAVEKQNIEIIKLLLSNDKLDINLLNILIFLFFF